MEREVVTEYAGAYAFYVVDSFVTVLCKAVVVSVCVRVELKQLALDPGKS